MLRKSLIAATALALVATPAIALADAASSLKNPPSKMTPLKILTPTAALSTGGSVVVVTVKMNTTGTPGFVSPALVTVCVGDTGCKFATLKANNSDLWTAKLKFPLQDIVMGPVKVSLQITAASAGYRTVLKNFVVTAS